MLQSATGMIVGATMAFEQASRTPRRRRRTRGVYALRSPCLSGRAVRVFALAPLSALLVVGMGAAATASAHRRTRHVGRTATTVIRSRVNSRVSARIVVDSTGYTLYVWVRRANSYGSAHNDNNFPPLIAHGRVVAAPGSKINGHQLGTRKLSNGQRQVTYHGQPLYLYKGDHKPGQANGENKLQGNSAWYVVQATNGRPAPPVY